MKIVQLVSRLKAVYVWFPRYVAVLVAVSLAVSFFLSRLLFPIFEPTAKLSVGANLKTQQVRILSRPVLLQTIYALKSDRSGAISVTVDDLLRDVRVKPIASSTVLVVSYRHTNPQFAVKVLNTLAVTFMAHDQFSQQQERIRIREYLEVQMAEKQKLLQTIEHNTSQVGGNRAAAREMVSKQVAQMDAISRAYDRLLAQYRTVVLSQVEPPSAVLFVESAVPPRQPIYPYSVLVFGVSFVIFSLIGLAGLVRWKQASIDECEREAQENSGVFTFASVGRSSVVDLGILAEPEETVTHRDTSEDVPELPVDMAMAPIELPEIAATPTESFGLTEFGEEDSIFANSDVEEPLGAEAIVTGVGQSSLFEETGYNAVLGYPSFQKRSTSIGIVGDQLGKKAVDWILPLLTALSEQSRKVVLVTFSDSLTMSNSFGVEMPQRSIADYMRGTPYASVIQSTPISGCVWISGDDDLLGISQDDSLSFLTRRLRVYADVVMYVIPSWMETVPLASLDGMVDGWVILMANGTSELAESFNLAGLPIAAQLPIDE